MTRRSATQRNQARRNSPQTEHIHPLLLSVLLGAVLWGAFVLAWGLLPTQEDFDKAASDRARDQNRVQASILPVRLVDLRRNVPAVQPSRDLFSFAAAPLRASVTLEEPKKEEIREKPEPEPKPEVAKKKPLDVTLLGTFGTERLRIAVLQDKAGEGISNVVEQDVIQETYQVQAIAPRSIELREMGVADAMPVQVNVRDDS